MNAEHSLASTLDVAAPFLPPALVSASALARIRGLGERVQAPLAQVVGLECRLGPQDQIDVAFGVRSPGRELLAGRRSNSEIATLKQFDPVWRRIGALCERWIDSLQERVEEFWLEFDLEAELDVTSTPSVFVAFAQESGCHDAIAVVETLAPELLTPSVRRNLENCFEQLAPTARIPYLGFMLPRKHPGVRVVIQMPESDMFSYLTSIGWPGDMDDLAGTMARLRTTDSPMAGLVNLDVADDIGHPVGLEYTLDRSRQVRGGLLEREFLDRLVELGACLPHKRNALDGWPGYSLERFPDEEWLSVMMRLVHYVKVVIAPGRAPTAKVYLSLISQPTSATSLSEIVLK